MYQNLTYVDVKPFDKDYSEIDTNLRFIDEVEFRGYMSNPDTFSNNIITTWYIDPKYSVDDFSNQVNDTVIMFTSLTDNDEAYIPVTWHVVKGVCVDTTIERRINLDEVFQPTGFTPNGDGVNDYLKFNGVENSDEYQLIIFNRWGTEVKRLKFPSDEPKNSIKEGWDGTNDDGNDLPEDTYYYVLYKYKGGGTEIDRGYIVLKRY
jgi:gliding motility-associated-like protein